MCVCANSNFKAFGSNKSCLRAKLGFKRRFLIQFTFQNLHIGLQKTVILKTKCRMWGRGGGHKSVMRMAPLTKSNHAVLPISE